MTKQKDFIIMLGNVRMAFPVLFTATRVNEEGKKAFSASFLMPPDHPVVAKIKAGIKAVAEAKWGDNASEILRALIAGDKVCLHNGDAKSNYDGYAGNLYVSARSSVRPLSIGQDKAALTEDDGVLYSGSYVNAQISLWAMQNNFGKRICAQLRGVQFLREGEAFSAGVAADVDDFSTVDDSADEPAPAPALDGEWADLT